MTATATAEMLFQVPAENLRKGNVLRLPVLPSGHRDVLLGQVEVYDNGLVYVSGLNRASKRFTTAVLRADEEVVVVAE